MVGLTEADILAEFGRGLIDAEYITPCVAHIRHLEAVRAERVRERFRGNYGEMSGMMEYFDRRVRELLGGHYGTG